MPLVFFPEYSIPGLFGLPIIPYLINNQWCAHGVQYSFSDFAERFKISESDQIILRLKYGS